MKRSFICIRLQELSNSKSRIILLPLPGSDIEFHKRLSSRAGIPAKTAALVLPLGLGLLVLLGLFVFGVVPVHAASDEALAAIREGSPIVAREACEKAAEEDDPDCQNVMGWLALKKSDNPEKAREWFEKAAAQGYSKALANLAYMLGSGLGGEQDLSRAATLYRQAREQVALEANEQEEASTRTEVVRIDPVPAIDTTRATEARFRSAFAEMLRLRVLHGLRRGEAEIYVADAELADARRTMARIEKALVATGINAANVRAEVERKQAIMLRFLSRKKEEFDSERRQEALAALARMAETAEAVR